MSENSNITMNELLESYDVSKIRTGDTIKGTVLAVNEDSISVNINYKSDGILSKENYSNSTTTDLNELVSVGDQIEATVLQMSDGDGNVVLSRRAIEEKNNWSKIVSLKKEDLIIDTTVVETNDFGAIAIVQNIRGFIPKNQLSINRNVKPSDYLGKEVKVKIIDTKNKKGKKQLILSSRAVEKIEKEKLENEIWQSLEEKGIYEGTVKKIVDYGAFVEINGIDGLLHINEIAWIRIKHPSDVIKEGEKIKVMIKKLDKENKKMSLSYKATIKNPWTVFIENYKKGDEVKGIISDIVDFGAFIIIDDVKCLLHIRDISWFRTEKVSDALSIGQEITTKILNINEKDKKINVGIKQLSVHPFDKFVQNVSVNDIIKVKIKRIVSDGVYVDLNEDLDSFINISKISKDKLRSPAQVVKIDEEKEAKIIGIDRKAKKIKLTFILINQDEDKFSNGKEPVSYTLGDDVFTIGDLFKNK